MKRIFLLSAVFLASLVSTSFAKDYASGWLSGGEAGKAYNQMFVKGFGQGISWAKTFVEFIKTVPRSDWDTRQRVMFHVFSNADKVDDSAAERMMTSLYTDPANAQIHRNLIFFAAAAKLLGVPQNEIDETLRLFRLPSGR